jgi:hypothetical protein
MVQERSEDNDNIESARGSLARETTSGQQNPRR